MDEQIEFPFGRTKKKSETTSEEYRFIDIETGNLITSTIINLAKVFELFIDDKGEFIKQSYKENPKYQIGVNKKGKALFKEYYEIIDEPSIYLIVIKRIDYINDRENMKIQMNEIYNSINSMKDVRLWKNKIITINKKPDENVKVYRKYTLSYKGIQYKIGINTLKYSFEQRMQIIKDFNNFLTINKTISSYQSEFLHYILMTSETLGQPIKNISIDQLPSVDGIQFIPKYIPNIIN